MIQEFDNEILVTGPPSASRNLITDFFNFFLHQPKIPTLVMLNSLRSREEYTKRVLQRIGIEVSGYSVLNFHKVAINAPVNVIFGEFITVTNYYFPTCRVPCFLKIPR